MPISLAFPLSHYIDTRLGLLHAAISWCWKVIDFAELKRSSISFFHGDNHETAISRWSRARTRAAKVGKGLSKSNKGQKLALRHWLEAIDPRHRYGHNLHFYYKEWLNSDSKQPFFYWLDIGEGKNKDLYIRCPRSTLEQQCIKYLDPLERKAYEISVEGGKLMKKQSSEPLHTTKDSKWIFVVSTSKVIYAGKKIKGSFQHSSFLAGGAALAAGRLVVQNGTLKAIWPHSGHYRPNRESFKDLLSFLAENNVDLTHVQVTPVDEEETSLTRQEKSSSTQKDLTRKMDGPGAAPKLLQQEKTDFGLKQSMTADLGAPNFIKQLSNLQAPEKTEINSPRTAHTNCRVSSLLGQLHSLPICLFKVFFGPTTHSFVGHILVSNIVQCKNCDFYNGKMVSLQILPQDDSSNIRIISRRKFIIFTSIIN